MKKNFICSKKSVRTFKSKIEPSFLSHAERGEPFQIQDFLRGIHLCRHFVPTPIQLQNAISISGGEGGIRTLDTREGMPLFESGRFNHSRTSPRPLPDCTFRIHSVAAASFVCRSFTPKNTTPSLCSVRSHFSGAPFFCGDLLHLHHILWFLKAQAGVEI